MPNLTNLKPGILPPSGRIQRVLVAVQGRHGSERIRPRRSRFALAGLEQLEGRMLLAADTTTTLSIASRSVVYGEDITFTARVASTVGTPTGSVQFQIDGFDEGAPVRLVNGVAAFVDNKISVGVHTPAAIYTPDSSDYAASTGRLQIEYVRTIAGNGDKQYNGDNIAPTDAAVYYPTCVTTDQQGNIYIVQMGANRVREIVKATGQIITVAGNGLKDFSGDGGDATNASLAWPTNATVDAEGNLFISDTYNHRIREVMRATGQIVTVAGNGEAGFNGDGQAATSTSLNAPRGLTFDSAGNLFFSDTLNHRVRELVKATGQIITVAGTGDPGFSGDGNAATAALLDEPRGLAFDHAGNLYVVDQLNQRIREVVMSTGAIRTVVGNGKIGYAGDGGPATDASLAYPYGLTVDGDGSIFLADQSNNEIREVFDDTGVIVTRVGGSAGFNGDGSVGTSTLLDTPLGVALDRDGGLLFTDSGNDRVRKLTFTNTLQVSVASTHADVRINPVWAYRPVDEYSVGDPITFLASVDMVSSPKPAVGVVQFIVDGLDYGTPMQLVDGKASLTTYALDAGSHSVRARYLSADPNVMNDLSDPWFVTVRTKLVITSQPMNALVYPGQTATFTASASGSPVPDVQWQVFTGKSGQWQDIPRATTTTIRTDAMNVSWSIPLVNRDFEAMPILGWDQTTVDTGNLKMIYTSDASNSSWYSQQISGIEGWTYATPGDGGIGSDHGLAKRNGAFGLDPTGQSAFINNWGRMMSQTVSTTLLTGDTVNASIDFGTLGDDTDGGRAGRFYLVAGEADPSNPDQFSTRSIILSEQSVANPTWTLFQPDVTVGNRQYQPLHLTYTYKPNDPAIGLPLTIAFRTETYSVGQTYWDNAALSLGHPLQGSSYRAVFTSMAGSVISDTATRLVIQVPTTTFVTDSKAQTLRGQAVVFTAAVTGIVGIPAGTVQFQIDGTNTGKPVKMMNGVARMTTRRLTAGPHTITVVYAGDGLNYLGSASAAIRHIVRTPAKSGHHGCHSHGAHPQGVSKRMLGGTPGHAQQSSAKLAAQPPLAHTKASPGLSLQKAAGHPSPGSTSR